MDAEDRSRTLSNKQKLLAALQARGVMLNHEVRAIAGTRGMGRAHELKVELAKLKPPQIITIRKLKGAVWEVRLDLKPLGRDAQTRKPAKPRKSAQSESLFQL